MFKRGDKVPEGYKRIFLKDLQNGHLEEGTEKKAPLHINASKYYRSNQYKWKVIRMLYFIGTNLFTHLFICVSICVKKKKRKGKPVSLCNDLHLQCYFCWFIAAHLIIYVLTLLWVCLAIWLAPTFSVLTFALCWSFPMAFFLSLTFTVLCISNSKFTNFRQHELCCLVVLPAVASEVYAEIPLISEYASHMHKL